MKVHLWYRQTRAVSSSISSKAATNLIQLLLGWITGLWFIRRECLVFFIEKKITSWEDELAIKRSDSIARPLVTFQAFLRRPRGINLLSKIQKRPGGILAFESMASFQGRFSWHFSSADFSFVRALFSTLKLWQAGYYLDSACRCGESNLVKLTATFDFPGSSQIWLLGTCCNQVGREGKKGC